MLFANFLAPKASAMVTNAGNASGMAATASEIVVINIVKTDSPRNHPTKKMIVQIMSMPTDNRLPKAANLFCKGVVTSSVWIILAMCPSSVCIPVATT
ncbi:hypothetical protein D3C85_1391140 [compost metagenome]